MLLSDKIKPIFFNEYIINKDITNKLQNFIKYDIDNLIIYGKEGSGKFTLLKSLLNEYYNTDIKTSLVSFKINTNYNNYKNISIYNSIYHFEIVINKYFISNKVLLINLLNIITSDSSVNNNDYKIIIIRNLHYANAEFILLIKNIIEKKYNSIKFLLTTTNLTNVIMLKTFCTLVRLNYSPKETISNYINKYVKSNNIKIKKNIIETIVNENYSYGLNKILIKLEKILINVKYEDILLDNYKIILQLMQEKKLININKIRNILYDLQSKNINIENIFKLLLNYIIKSKIKEKEKVIDLIIKYNINYSKSYKSIIQIESLIINIIPYL
jgi:hypothetical protein